MGTKVTWQIGPRIPITQTTTIKGKTHTTARTGKNGGPCFEQSVTKIISPR